MRRTTILSLLIILFAASSNAQPKCTGASTELIPINDLKSGTFNGWTGGLYPNGSNYLPSAHKTAGMIIAANQIFPRDVSGNRDDVNGKIVWLSIGMSNTTAETLQFITLAKADPNKNPRLVFVDGAVGGMTASIISTKTNSKYSTYWSTVANRLLNAGVNENQVQVIWYKEANVASSTPIMIYYDSLVVQTKRSMNIIKQRFPNARLCYMSSRISGRYASSNLNPEPYAYYSGWAIKKVIEDQINGDAELKYSGSGANSPWLSWGPYMWSDGSTPQVTNPSVFWICPSDFQNDGTHPSNAGAIKVGNLLLNFYKKDTVSCPWFFSNPPSYCSAATGIKDTLETFFSVFPNPVINYLHINTSLQEYIFTLYNTSGQMIYQERDVKDLNVSFITCGLYHYTIKTRTGKIYSSSVLILK